MQGVIQELVKVASTVRQGMISCLSTIYWPKEVTLPTGLRHPIVIDTSFKVYVGPKRKCGGDQRLIRAWSGQSCALVKSFKGTMPVAFASICTRTYRVQASDFSQEHYCKKQSSKSHIGGDPSMLDFNDFLIQQRRV